jgi:hypothetical protein
MPADPLPVLEITTDPDVEPADLRPLVELLLNEMTRLQGEPPIDSANKRGPN